MKRILLEGNGWNDREDFYHSLLLALGAPDWHGHSLDALNDSLSGGDINSVNPPLEIAISGVSSMPESLRGHLEQFAQLAEELREKGIRVEISLLSDDCSNPNLGSDDSDSFDLYRQARDLMEKGLLEEAVIHFRQSIASSPHFKTLELLGECLIRLNRHSEAIVPLAAATSLNKGVRAPSLLAQVFLKLDQFQDAREMAEVALSRDPNNQKALQVKVAAAAHMTDA